MRKNLFDLSIVNAPILNQQFAELSGRLGSLPHVGWLDFCQSCEEGWTLSISYNPERLLFFIDTGSPYNRYKFDELAKGLPVFYTDPVSYGTQVNWETYLAGWVLDEWTPKRRVFNEHVDLEERIKYGNYYVQGDGNVNFGGFSLIFKKDKVLAFQGLTFLKGDSLQFYIIERNGQFDIDFDKLSIEIANVTNVSQLVAMKKEKDLIEHGQEYALNTICIQDEYVEAQLVDDYDLEMVKEVVSKPMDMKMVNDFVTSPKVGQTLKELDSPYRDIAATLQIISKLKTKGCLFRYI